MTSDITAIDFFCGAGGSSSGLVAAGVQVKAACNHWKIAIDTHNTNHPQTDHYLNDLQQAHASWYPRTTIAWFSPSCTNHSLAKGKKRKGIGQLDLWGESGVDPAEERSRATMREVVEFSDYHRYEVVIVENVVDIRNWQYYDEWLTAMLNMGYVHKILYLNAQFFNVPQSRDRFYAVFWKKGNRAPNLEFRPAALCPEHGLIEAVQVFKKHEFQWGRYGARRQYTYRCPHCGADVMPAVRPASDIIDWSITSEKIGERKVPLKEKTIQRVMAGLNKYGQWPHIADLGHSHAEHKGKVQSVDSPLSTETTQQRHVLVQPFIASYHGEWDAVKPLTEPLRTVTTFNHEHALVSPPFMVILKNSWSADGKYTLPPRGLDQPLTTVVGSASQHGLVTPMLLGYYNNESIPVPVDEPVRTIAGRNTPALVTPPFIMAHYNNPVFSALSQPMSTIPGVNHHSLITPEDMLPECGFRMLSPEELKRGMSFPDAYVILGNKRDQVRQIGNAVCCNVAEAIARRVVESLQ